MNNKIICPACGSDNVKRFENEAVGQLTLGSIFKFTEIICECSNCGVKGDFLNETEPYYLKAEKKAQAILIKDLIEDLKQLNISMSFFERVFELPFRTLTRWKSGDFSATSLALLRIVKTFPWIAEVAEERFSSDKVEEIMEREVFVSSGNEGFNETNITRRDFNCEVNAVPELRLVG